MVTFNSEQVTPHIRRITDGTDVCMYLVEGDRLAALIDTGYGIGNLKGYVESLTAKPYAVYLTHGHVDHASGAGPFATVYLHPADAELLHRHCTVATRKASLAECGNVLPDLTEDDFVPMRTAGYEPMLDGMRVDLGGVTVKWISVPGHTKGSMVPLIEEDRAIMFGDACGVGTILCSTESTTIQEYLASLLHLKKYEDQYDIVLREHGTFASTKQVLDDNIANCRKILMGEDDAEEVVTHGMRALRACRVDPQTGARVDGREGNILYDPLRIV